MNAGDVSGSVALDSVSSVTFTQDTDGTIILHCAQNDVETTGSDEEPEHVHKRLRLSSEEADDPASMPAAYSVVALPLSEREESFEVTMTATEMKTQQENEDLSQVFACVFNILNLRRVVQVRIIDHTKDVLPCHKWKQGMWSKEEIDILMSNIENYVKKRGVQDPSEIIFEMSKEERKDFYRSIAWGLNRPLFAVYRRVLRMYDNRNHVGKYTQEEIEKLKELRQKHGNDWATIGAALGRSASSVKDRCRLMKDTCHTGKWTEEEERRLTEVVHELTGTEAGDMVTQGVSWASVADLVGTRSEKQCRSKWLNYLNWKQSGGTDFECWRVTESVCRIMELAVDDENEINWDILAEGWSSVRSPQWLRSKWWTIKRQVANHKELPFDGTQNRIQYTYYIFCVFLFTEFVCAFVCIVLLKGLQDIVEAPPSTMNKVVVVGSRSVHASPSPVTALQLPVQIPVQITHVSSSESTSGSSESGTITLNSGALQTFELLPSFHLQPTGTPGTYFLQTGSNQNLPLTLSTNSTVTLTATGSPGSPEQIILHSLAGDSLSDNVTVQMSHPGIIIQTVTSEDLPDPLNQSELISEQDLGSEEVSERPECSKEEDESSEQNSKVMTNDSADTNLELKEEEANGGIGGSTVLIVPSPNSFIPSSDITSNSVLPVGTLTDPILQNQEEGPD
ncbi:Cyclin-D-binding Myb-like transcription factor 1 [Bagarius yarrelli]|uniref:Cyclin-D-binding Myb-like transcription factor 1 n=1 Tax=Bagarius yarrelli TaxID=175774 RepID=A0A556THK1_BAGYA|nr:Cyclin-D-binding Myb-like transcription factor 1 [Bagarius yarrelli]